MHWAEGEDEPWYLLSDQPVGCPTLRRYEKRMWTDGMYGGLKGRRDKSYFRIGLDFVGLCLSRGDPLRVHLRPYFQKW